MEQHQMATATGLVRNSPPLGSANQGPPRSAMSPPIYRRSTPGSLHPSPRIPRAESIRRSHSAASMSPPVSVSSQMRHGELLQSIESRPLPTRDISDETIDDAYVDFIFYCNPGVPTNTNTSELRRMFRSLPRSDGKSFNIYTLWELIQKLDRKELRTWIQLAIELGVEPPSLEKKQSTQKVQQYAVRLKRWMRAMHVDAFFDYCLGHPHPYYNNPRVSNDHDGDTGDAVSKEEDLALRALFPEWKPKKGRKRAMDELKPPKRPRLDTQNISTDAGNPSYAPWSAIPDEFEQHDNWGTNSVFSTSSQTENPRHTGPQRSSPLRYPQSAVTPRSRNPDVFFEREPRSAITPNSTNKMYYNRTRDQPAIRPWIPPRNIAPDETGNQQSLDFSTRTDPAVALCPEMTMAYEPSPNNAHCDPLCAERVSLETTSNTGQDSNGASAHPNSTAPRPVKLQLQVPKGSPRPPIRLATPQLLVNGEFRQPSIPIEAQSFRDATHQQIHNAQNSHAMHTGTSLHPNNQPTLLSSISLIGIARMFSHEILKARNSECPAISERDANAITEAIIKQIRSDCAPNCSSEMTALYCATYLGLGYQLGLGARRLGPLHIKLLPGVDGSSSRVREMDICIPTPSTALDNVSQSPPKTLCIISYDILLAPGITTKTTIQASVVLDSQNHTKSNNINPSMERATKDTSQTTIDDSDDELCLMEAGVDWKQRYLNLKKQNRKRDAALRLYKKNILEAVMNDI